MKQAELGEYCDEEGDCSYRVELISDMSDAMPLMAFYSTGRAEKQAAVDQINIFMAQSDKGNLSITLSGVGGQMWWVILPVLAGAAGLWLISAGLKLTRQNRSLT